MESKAPAFSGVFSGEQKGNEVKVKPATNERQRSTPQVLQAAKMPAQTQEIVTWQSHGEEPASRLEVITEKAGCVNCDLTTTNDHMPLLVIVLWMTLDNVADGI